MLDKYFSTDFDLYKSLKAGQVGFHIDCSICFYPLDNNYVLYYLHPMNRHVQGNYLPISQKAPQHCS